MIYTKKTKIAMNIAYKAHMNQYGKDGIPYIFHPIHIAEQMNDEATTIVALLHDVVEDTNITLDELRKYFDEDVIKAIDALTHKDNMDYFEYISIVNQNYIARTVKIADLLHNRDLSRLDEITEKDKKRAEKYRDATVILALNDEIE